MNLSELSAKERVFLMARDDLLKFAPACLKIEDKSGKLIDFSLNKAQRYMHARLEKQIRETGKVRALILKGRQQGCCFAPHHKVLLADLTWRQIGDIRPGDRVVAVDENIGDSGETSSGRSMCRRFKTATVEVVARRQMKTFMVTMASGRELIVTGKHRMLFRRRRGSEAQWRSISEAKAGDYIRSAFRPPVTETGYEDGWFAGIIDGEGHRSSPNESGLSVSVHQVAGQVLDRIKSYLIDSGIRFYETLDKRQQNDATKLGNKVVHRIEIGRLADVVALMDRCKTSRVRFSSNDLDGRKIGGNRTPEGEGKQFSWDEIVSIKPHGLMEVVDLQTSAKTYIVDGLVSHNSTYIGARFYHQTIFFKQRAFIVAHEQKATDNLFTMVKRYHQHNPLAPSTGATNSKELVFDKLDAGYKLATAGSRDVGRSNTAQLLHGSEVAFWDNAAEHLAGVGNTIGDQAGTEIILESTANGVGTPFHTLWQSAERGEGEYIAIFVPWFWQAEYRAPLPDGFVLNADEVAYAETYGLDNNQMAWRRNKVITYGPGREWLFDQEFPATASLAFRSNTDDPFITPNLVMAAVNCSYRDSIGPLVIGVDPADQGKDRTAIAFRRGRVVSRIHTYQGRSTMEVAGIVSNMIKEHTPDAVMVDATGIGAGIADRLRELGHQVFAVHSAQKADDHANLANKRAEMWTRFRNWLMDGPVRLPNDPAMIADITAPSYRYDSSGRLLIEKKEGMKKRGLRSPDVADAIALTFAEHVGSHQARAIAIRASNYKAPSSAGY